MKPEMTDMAVLMLNLAACSRNASHLATQRGHVLVPGWHSIRIAPCDVSERKKIAKERAIQNWP